MQGIESNNLLFNNEKQMKRKTTIKPEGIPFCPPRSNVLAYSKYMSNVYAHYGKEHYKHKVKGTIKASQS